MAEKVFVDTGAWLALADTSDHLHQTAQKIFALLLRGGSQLVTTNLVVAETYTLIRRRVGHKAAIRFLQSIRSSPRLERVYINADVELQAEAILQQYADQDFSYVDAVSFAVMRGRGMKSAFAFDRHFLLTGFLLIPA